MIGIFEGIEIGTWYRTPDGATFEVVALDFGSEGIEVQYYDGSVAELDFDSWLELSPVPTSAPDDLDGALDMDYAGYGSDLDVSSLGSTANPIDQIDWH